MTYQELYDQYMKSTNPFTGRNNYERNKEKYGEEGANQIRESWIQQQLEGNSWTPSKYSGIGIANSLKNGKNIFNTPIEELTSKENVQEAYESSTAGKIDQATGGDILGIQGSGLVDRPVSGILGSGLRETPSAGNPSEIQDMTGKNENIEINADNYMQYGTPEELKQWAREDTAYQRAVKDMQAAGINPNLVGVTPAASNPTITQSGMNINWQEIEQYLDQEFNANENQKDRLLDMFGSLLSAAVIAKGLKR